MSFTNPKDNPRYKYAFLLIIEIEEFSLEEGDSNNNYYFVI